jgi:hypothetical protein
MLLLPLPKQKGLLVPANTDGQEDILKAGHQGHWPLAKKAQHEAETKNTKIKSMRLPSWLALNAKQKRN